MQFNIKKATGVIIFSILAVIAFSCKQKNVYKIPSQTFYYEFIGFESWTDNTAPFIKIVEDFANFDYIITKHEVLLPIPKKEIISKDSLNDFHKLIHKIELFSENETYTADDIKMVIRFLPQTENSTAAFQYFRYVYSATEGWKLKYNLGKHQLAGLPDNKEKRIRFLATEIARASFK